MIDFIISTSTLSILIAFLLITYIIFQIAIDVKEIIHSKKLHSKLMDIAKIQSLQTISVVIELTKSAETILPLLSHLSEHKYSKLEIIVIIKHTAGKKSGKILARYRRHNKLNCLKIINHKKGWKIQDYIRRYGSGKLSVVLNIDMRLSPGFFTNASIESINNDNAIIALPRQHMALNETIASALQTNADNLRQFIKLTKIQTSIFPLRSGLIYNNKLIVNDFKMTSVLLLPISQQLYISNTTNKNSMKNYFNKSITNTTEILKSKYGIISLLIITCLAITSIVLFEPDEILILLDLIIALYVLTIIVMQIRLKGYSLIEHINLVLIAPFSLLFMVLVYVCSLINLITKIIYKACKKLLIAIHFPPQLKRKKSFSSQNSNV